MISPDDCLMDSDEPQDRVLLQDRGTLLDDVIAFKEMSQCVEGEMKRVLELAANTQSHPTQLYVLLFS